MSFIEKLDEKSLAAFIVACKKPFSEQAQFFLNAFWDEYGSQAECIYTVAWEVIKRADMRVRNVTYVHMYEEGCDLDFDMGLYFFEQLVKFYDEPKPIVINGLVGPDVAKQYGPSVPKEMTAVVRKKELREKVDVNFDGRVSFIEYLLYQYEASPKDLMDRQSTGTMPAEVLAAMAALDEVNKRVRAYETEKCRLEEESQSNNGTGIKALKAKNELAQLISGPLWEQINKALILAEAAVRIAQKKYGSGSGYEGGAGCPRTSGTMWWLNRELQAKKEKYGPRSK